MPDRPSARPASRDSLGDRIKAHEARETARRAVPGLPLVLRVDGRSFSRFTRGMRRPFDPDLADLMVEVARYLVRETGALVAHTQSDEVSLVLDPTGIPGPEEVIQAVRGIDLGARPAGPFLEFLEASAAALGRVPGSPGAPDFPFGGRFQKICSVVAGLATARFLQGALALWPDRCARSLPVFDCRAFQVPNRYEAVAALLWRELDAAKNAVSMAARAHFPHGRLQGKTSAQMQEMLFRERGVNFNDYPARFKRGVYLRRRAVTRDLPPERLALIPEANRPAGPVLRHEVVCLDLPPLTRVLNPVAILLAGTEPVRADNRDPGETEPHARPSPHGTEGDSR